MKQIPKNRQRKIQEAMNIIAEWIEDDTLFTQGETYMLRRMVSAVNCAVFRCTTPAYTSATLDEDLKIHANDIYVLMEEL